MIGYMKPLKNELKQEQGRIYQALYCGLCRNLNYEYGLRGTFLINYEIVDVLLIIEAMLVEKPSAINKSCSITPFIWKKMIGYDDALFKLGAAISVIVISFELKDNIIDDGKTRDKVLYSLLKKAIEKVKFMYPDEWSAIEKTYDDYMLIERDVQRDNSGFYSILSSCGEITRKIGEILGSSLSKQYANSIGILMYYWGQWIYLLDAIDDFEEDCKKNTFNPLKLSDRAYDLLELLQELEGNIIDIVEGFPFQRYEDLIFTLFGEHFSKKRRLVCQKSKYCQEVSGFEAYF